MALGGAILGGAILGGAMPMPQSAPASLPYALYEGFRLDLMDGDGDRLAVLVGASDTQWSEAINEPGTLTFTIPVDAYYAELMTPPNYIALYDRGNNLVQVFEIVDVEESYDEQRNMRISCADPAYLLNDDSIEYQNYITDLDDGDTAVVTIAAILALQTNTRKITLGGIEASLSGLSYQLRVEWETPLAALQRLRDIIGGFFWVDKDLKLWWRETNTSRDTRELRWEKNLLAFQPSINNDGVITHLRYLGAKIAGTHVALPSPGYIVSPDYTIGDRKRWHTEIDDSILFQTTLEKAAAVFMSEHSRPMVSATVRILDLSQSPKYDFDAWYGVQLGDRVKVYHPSLGASPLELSVVSRQVALDKPMDVALELGSLPPDIARIIADMRNYQRYSNGGGGGDGEVTDFETDPGVFEPPGTPDTVSVGTSPNTIRADAVLPILPGVGYTPEAITPGLGASGTGPYAAPQDHAHPLDIAEFEAAGFVTTDTLADDLVSEFTEPIDTGLSDALDNIIEGHAADSAGYAVVSMDPEAGTSVLYSRADHTHLGQPWISAADKASLPTTGHADGVVGYTSGSGDESPWFRVAGAWIQPTIYLGEVSTLPDIPTAYAATCRFALQLWAAGPGDTYWTPMQRQTTYSGAPATEYP